MEAFSGTISPPSMYVKALYDYDADDRTSLSFRAGDIIQVITQLESGWWDGVMNGARGWFPSNYCVLISAIEADRAQERERRHREHDLEDLSEEDDPDEAEYQQTAYRATLQDEDTQQKARHSLHKAPAAFWIPQATPDGQLFYFNTLTGESTMELPMESPTTVDETGPHDRTNVYIPQHTRPPPEMMASGYERDADTDYDHSGSETEGLSHVRSSPRKRRSYMSDGVSPATSVDSLSLASRGDLPQSSTRSISQDLNSLHLESQSSLSGNSSGPNGASSISTKYFNDSSDTSLTWNTLIEDMRAAVDRYREAINHSDRSKFVKRAEEMSDLLRLLLGAGAGTTDHYFGIPSAISENKELYPRYRDMMSRFSKLTLSSHMAAANWSQTDQYAKCLQEADGVLNGVYGFVEVARRQQGEVIPRLFPGFIVDSSTGGNWRNNGIGPSGPIVSTSFRGNTNPPDNINTVLDSNLLEQMDNLKKSITSSIRLLESHLVLRDMTLSAAKHRKLGEIICSACQKVVEQFRPWLSTTESINLSSLSLPSQSSAVLEFIDRKQKIYDLVAELVVVCQAVTAPLGDEWSDTRNDCLEDRLKTVQKAARDLDIATNQVVQSLRQLLDIMPEFPKSSMSSSRSDATNETSSSAVPLLVTSAPHPTRDVGSDSIQARTPTSAMDPGGDLYRNGDNSKLKQFFGEVPVHSSARTDEDNHEPFMKLDHEGEIQYYHKTDPPQIKGGTLTGLVEQLTRHDRQNLGFNNTFLLTYQSFTTASELFEMIIKRWNIQPPFDLSEEDHKKWKAQKQDLIRFRIVNVLKTWFDWYWMEDSEPASKNLMLKILEFARDTIASCQTPGAQNLMASIEQRMNGQDANSKRRVQTQNTQPPPPILPKNMKKLKFLDIDALEFARQLTIIESRLYSKIKPHECLNKVWQKKVSKLDSETAGNVKALILHSNQLTNWVAQMILSQQELKKRVIVIKHFVSVADKCLSMNNFSTLTSIISALGTAPIHRLNRTWAATNAKTTTTLEKMRRLMGSTKNFAEYRDALRAAVPPCIPFFGVYLTDLTFIEDGIPSMLKKSDLINFSKRDKTADVIREVQSYQNVQYALKSVPELQDYVLSMMQSAGDVHEMYDKSLQVEPREREDEKIARLLSESGFM